MACLHCAPMSRSTSRPSFRISSVGMLWTPKRDAVRGLESTSSLPTSARPENSAAICSTTGAIILHGPHHAAHRSSRTGMDDASTTDEKLASVTMTGFKDADESGLWHLPQTGAFPATFVSDMRLRVRQIAHSTIRLFLGSAIFKFYRIVWSDPRL